VFQGAGRPLDAVEHPLQRQLGPAGEQAQHQRVPGDPAGPLASWQHPVQPLAQHPGQRPLAPGDRAQADADAPAECHRPPAGEPPLLAGERRGVPLDVRPPLEPVPQPREHGACRQRDRQRARPEPVAGALVKRLQRLLDAGRGRAREAPHRQDVTRGPQRAAPQPLTRPVPEGPLQAEPGEHGGEVDRRRGPPPARVVGLGPRRTGQPPRHHLHGVMDQPGSRHRQGHPGAGDNRLVGGAPRHQRPLQRPRHHRRRHEHAGLLGPAAERPDQRPRVRPPHRGPPRARAAVQEPRMRRFCSSNSASLSSPWSFSWPSSLSWDSLLSMSSAGAAGASS
jgi:hypothetical protein